jgi:hypothetical protein
MYLKFSVSDIRLRKSPLIAIEINELGGFIRNSIISYNETL